MPSGTWYQSDPSMFHAHHDHDDDDDEEEEEEDDDDDDDDLGPRCVQSLPASNSTHRFRKGRTLCGPQRWPNSW